MIFLQLFKCGFKEKMLFFLTSLIIKFFLHWNTKHFMALHYPTGNRFVSRTIIWSSDPPRSHSLSTVFEPIALSHVPIFFLFCCPHCLILTVYHHYSHHPPTLCFYTVPDFLLFSTFFPFICPVFSGFFSDRVILPYSLYNTTGSPKASVLKWSAVLCSVHLSQPPLGLPKVYCRENLDQNSLECPPESQSTFIMGAKALSALSSTPFYKHKGLL